MKKYQKLSVYISFLLRHKPETLNLDMDKQGYVLVDEFIEKINNTSEYKDQLTKEILETIVKEDEKQRYSYDVSKTMIRANQGHSFPVFVAKEGVPPTYLYHGTSISSLSAIKEFGIKKMKREYVHFSKDIDTAKIVALRHGKTIDNIVVLSINTTKMLEDGYKFFVSENGIWLIDYVPYQYVETVMYFK